MKIQAEVIFTDKEFAPIRISGSNFVEDLSVREAIEFYEQLYQTIIKAVVSDEPLTKEEIDFGKKLGESLKDKLKT